MDSALNNALNQLDIQHVLLMAIEHADTRMRKFIWRGYRPKVSAQNELMVGDKTAQDFVNEALRRLCDGTRTYNPGKNLLENLNSITDSLIWSEKKSSDRTGIVDFVENANESDKPQDPILKAVSLDSGAAVNLVDSEVATCQQKCFQLVRMAFDGDDEMQAYLDAMSEGFLDIQEISNLTDIPVPKIYELRRKLKNFAPGFFGVANYEEMERKIKEGQ